MSELDLIDVNEDIDPEVTTFDNPSLQVTVAPVAGNNCRYRFTFTVAKDKKDIKSGKINFTLNGGFATPGNVTPTNNSDPTLPPQFNYSKPNGSWNFGELNATTPSRTLTFEADYIGASGVLILPSVTWNVTFKDNTESGTLTKNVDTKTTAACPAPCLHPSCCEECGSEILHSVTLKPCDDYVPVPVDVAVTPRGRKIAVNLDVPPVCNTKAVNIGVYVTEVLANGSEIPFAHKVISRASTGITGTCANDRDCNCVEFFINDDDACAATRTFNIRVKAHYLDTNLTEAQQCSCCCPIA